MLCATLAGVKIPFLISHVIGVFGSTTTDDKKIERPSHAKAILHTQAPTSTTAKTVLRLHETPTGADGCIVTGQKKMHFKSRIRGAQERPVQVLAL